MSTTTLPRQRFALKPGEELVPRPRKPRPLIGAGSAGHPEFDARAQLTAVAEEAWAEGDKRAAACLWHALEIFGKRRPDGIPAYKPQPAAPSESNVRILKLEPGTLTPEQLKAVTTEDRTPAAEFLKEAEPPKAASKPPTPKAVEIAAEGTGTPEQLAAFDKAAAKPATAAPAGAAATGSPSAANATEGKQEAPAGILAAQIKQAKTVKLKQALRALEAEDMPDAVKKAKATALLNQAPA